MGKSLSWSLDPATGDYLMNSNGTPKETDSLTIPAYIRLKARRTKWLYAPDPDWGSDFYSVQKRHQPKDGSNLEAIALRALKPLIDDGRASTITVTASVQSRYGVGLETEIIDASGSPDQLNLPAIR